MTSPKPPWSLPVRADDVPEGGRHVEMHADSTTRDALAKFVGLLELTRLDVTFDVTRYGRNGLRVAGTVSASVRQACVVTLDPVDNEIEETVGLVFVPGHRYSLPDVVLSADGALGASEPEPLVDGTVDLGAIATEFLMLGIDPYPRKPGVVFAPPAVKGKSDQPFSALAALHKGRRDGEQ